MMNQWKQQWSVIASTILLTISYAMVPAFAETKNPQLNDHHNEIAYVQVAPVSQKQILKATITPNIAFDIVDTDAVFIQNGEADQGASILVAQR